VAFFFAGLAREQAGIEAKSITPLMAAILLTVNLSSAAVDEEPLFRGFLWGWLLKRGWRDGWILLFQAVFFWAGHLYYLGRMPLSLWVIVPVSGVALGLLAWRSRDIAPAMVAHGIIDGLTQALAGLGERKIGVR
jgi:membrane protease YdiL (CAAX protease family)